MMKTLNQEECVGDFDLEFCLGGKFHTGVFTFRGSVGNIWYRFSGQGDG